MLQWSIESDRIVANVISIAQYRILIGFGIVCIALVVINGWLYLSNRDLQREVAQRQQYLQQSAQLEVLYRDIVKALAELSIRNRDARVMEMLASQGITVNPDAPVTSAPTTREPAPEAKR